MTATATDSMTTQLSQRRHEANLKFLALATKEALGQSRQADAKVLESLLLITGKSPTEFDALVGVVKDRARLQEASSDKRLNECGRKVHEAHRELRDYCEETRRIAEERMHRERELHNDVNQAGGRLSAVERARSALAELELQHADLLGLEDQNLDAYSLTCNGEGIHISDPAAPTREVAQETFKREQQQRRGMMDEAHAIARREHEARWEKHRDKHRDQRTPPPGPELTLPTWKDIATAA